jgi:cbb3-type cytochrome oxidase subunit 3
MNPLIQEAVQSVHLAWLLAAFTVFFLGLFVLLVWWTYSPGNKRRFEDAARIPFSDGGDS